MQPARRLYIGTSGWAYEFWVGNFYPEGTQKARFLEEYARRFNSVEVDSTYYAIPPASMVRRWRERVPEGFKFAAKFPREITEENMFRDVKGMVDAFLKNISLLGEKLGPLLIQLPYSFDPESYFVLKDFLSTLPCGFRYAVEAKNSKWLGDQFYSLLRDHKMALVLVDHPWAPKVDVLTADFSYIRWEGDKSKIRGTTGGVEVDRSGEAGAWANRIRKILEVADVYGYFTKYYSGHSPTDALRMLQMLRAS